MALKEQVQACYEELRKTYAAFGIQKDPSWDEIDIGRLVQMHGLEKTRTAIRGARFEAATDTFKPKDYFSIRRLARPEVFEKCVNLGLQKIQQAPAQPKVEIETEISQEEVDAAKEKIRGLMGIFKSMPKESSYETKERKK